MINTKHLQKVVIAWTSIVWTVCFVAVALFPSIQPAFMYYAVHSMTSLGVGVMTLTTFLSGLVIWDVIVWLSAGLFGYLFNRIKA